MAIIDAVQAFQERWAQTGIKGKPRYHVVLGSGFGEALKAVTAEGAWRLESEFPFFELPGVARTSVQDHAGTFAFYRHLASGTGVVFQKGRLHGYEGHTAAQAVQPVMISRLSGVDRFLLTNAAGSLDASLRPGHVMLILDHVNLTGQNPLVGENPKSLSGEPLGPRFPDLSALYESAWQTALQEQMQRQDLRVGRGTYLGLLGPSFETPAEIVLFVKWGLQAVGMSTVWEAIALKHSGAKVAGLSLISNLACGLESDQALNHSEILELCRSSSAKIVRAILGWMEIEA